jgi:hypothetical protein
MTKLEVTKIEEQTNGRLLFNVRAHTSQGRIEFPIGIQDLGSPALDEVAVLRATLGVADELAASIRLRLDAAGAASRPQTFGLAQRSAAASPSRPS